RNRAMSVFVAVAVEGHDKATPRGRGHRARPTADGRPCHARRCGIPFALPSSAPQSTRSTPAAHSFRVREARGLTPVPERFQNRPARVLDTHGRPPGSGARPRPAMDPLPAPGTHRRPPPPPVPVPIPGRPRRATRHEAAQSRFVPALPPMRPFPYLFGTAACAVILAGPCDRPRPRADAHGSELKGRTGCRTPTRRNTTTRSTTKTNHAPPSSPSENRQTVAKSVASPAARSYWSTSLTRTWSETVSAGA